MLVLGVRRVAPAWENQKVDALTMRVVPQLRSNEREQLAVLLIAVVAQGASVGFLPPLARAEAER
ncbi:MAG: hypothetical protein ACR2JY_23865 [Chloroflexota bacterium]